MAVGRRGRGGGRGPTGHTDPALADGPAPAPLPLRLLGPASLAELVLLEKCKYNPVARPHPSDNETTILFQTSITRPLIENGGGVEVVDLEASQSVPCSCPSPYQKVRSALCRCCGHRG